MSTAAGSLRCLDAAAEVGVGRTALTALGLGGNDQDLHVVAKSSLPQTYAYQADGSIRFLPALQPHQASWGHRVWRLSNGQFQESRFESPQMATNPGSTE